MIDGSQLVDGLSLTQWKASFRPGMHEFAASNFTFSHENKEQVRIAFCNNGPYIDAQTRIPVYTHAVTLSPETAVELARLLLKHYAEPAHDRSTSSGEV